MPDAPVKRKIRLRKKPESFHHGDLREATLLLALREVEAHGHTQLTLEKLAAKLGVTRPALYRHFSSRDHLLREVLIEGYPRFEKALVEGLRGEADPWKSLHAYGCAYVRFAMENPGWFRLAFSRSQSEGMDDLIATSHVPAFVPLQFAALSSRFGKDHPHLNDLFRVLWASAHGLAVFVIDRVFRMVKTGEERFQAASDALATLIESYHALSTSRAGRLDWAVRDKVLPGLSDIAQGRKPPGAERDGDGGGKKRER
jgi:AcrR family transcriptional regulator